VPGVQFVLEPDRQPESPYAFREDRFVIGPPNAGGFFRWVGVPPGVYSMFAFAEIPPGLYFDSQFNERIFNRGIRVIVTDGAVLADRIFEMTGCKSLPPYIDAIYINPDGSLKVNPIPPHDADCLIPIPREESIGVFR
jgi:hypothetical protein